MTGPQHRILSSGTCVTDLQLLQVCDCTSVKGDLKTVDGVQMLVGPVAAAAYFCYLSGI